MPERSVVAEYYAPHFDEGEVIDLQMARGVDPYDQGVALADAFNYAASSEALRSGIEDLPDYCEEIAHVGKLVEIMLRPTRIQ